jgi:uncharacterized phage protein (TIGR01671 family)
MKKENNMFSKYRAWHKEKKMMFSVGVINFIAKIVMLGTSPDIVQKDEVILMQSTGLKDVKGKEIFEGDIVQRESFTGTLYRYVIGKDRVKFKISQAFVKFPKNKEFNEMEVHEVWFSMIDFEEIEIIGNIHKNPELVEVKE